MEMLLAVKMGLVSAVSLEKKMEVLKVHLLADLLEKKMEML